MGTKTFEHHPTESNIVNTSLARSLSTPADDDTVDASLPTLTIPRPSGNDAWFRPPRLVLQDAQEPDNTIIRSCMLPEPSSGTPNHEVDTPPAVSDPQAYIGDSISCHSCPPGCDKKHFLLSVPRTTLKPKEYERLQYDFKGIARNLSKRVEGDPSEIKHNMAQLGSTMKDVKVQSPLVSNEVHKPASASYGANSGSPPTVAMERTRTLSAAIASDSTLDPIPRSRRLSDLSVEGHPSHDLPLNSKPFTPSLLSGASKTSSFRHALLKSPVSVAQAIDVGLPVPPVLTPIAAVINSPETAKLGTPPLKPLSRFITGADKLGEPTKGQPPGSPTNAEAVESTYCGLRSAVEEAVQDAVQDAAQVAVRNAVHEIAMPARGGDDKASGAYRILVAKTLAEAAKNVDDDLRRASLLNERGIEPSLENLPVLKTFEPVASVQLSASPGLNIENSPVPHISTPKAVASSEMSQEHLTAKARRALHSESSAISAKSARSVGQEHTVGQKLSQESLDHKNPVHWLCDFITKAGSYETQLTALPPRTRRDQHGSKRCLKSESGPPKSSNEFCVGVALTPEVYMGTANENAIGSRVTDNFTRTINDLEYLLNEALVIARQAADREDASGLLGKATAVLKDGRNGGGSCESGSADTQFYHYTPARSVREYDPTVARQPVAADTMIADQPVGSSPTVKATLLKDSISPFPPLPNNISSSQPKADLDDKAPNVPLKDSKESRTPLGSHKRKADRTLTSSHDVLEPLKSTRTRNQVSPLKRKVRAGMSISTKSREITSGDEENLPMPPHLSAVTHRSESRGSYHEDDPTVITDRRISNTIPNKREVREYIRVFHNPPVQPRGSSRKLRQQTGPMLEEPKRATSTADFASNDIENDRLTIKSIHSFDGESEIDFNTQYGSQNRAAGQTEGESHDKVRELKDIPDPNLPQRHKSGGHKSGGHKSSGRMDHYHHMFDLKNRSHISLKEHQGFSLRRSHRRRPIARDWSPARKRFVATVACISTALVGVIAGIYAGEVPAMQYYIADFHHFVILGNVVFFIGLAVPTLIFWPLPLLHGRKPYILGSMTLAMPLLFPQAVVISGFRSPYLSYWRVCLLLPRAMMGLALGFANMNFKNMLMDLFGASLQSEVLHQEIVDNFDVRRHGGGMGVWLGIWTWCSTGSVGIGFLIGAVIINSLTPSWGFYISISIIAGVLLLNVVTPEVRRSAFRRSVAEVKTPTDTSRRLARGEVMMHRVQTGPKWWGEEFYHGLLLTQSMLRQPGFLVLTLYVGWIYGQIVLIVVLLGSLTSNYYYFKSPDVGASVAAVPLGALLAIPFQKASILSRARNHAQTTNAQTFDKKLHWSSHLVRRAVFTLCLPFAGLAYTLTSHGPPTPWILPILFAALIGFLSNLAIAECNGLIMETFDTSDLQPGMTGRPRGSSGERTAHKRTNYSSFPRVSCGFAITQSLGYLLGALATGVGGVAQRHLGQQAATGIMAGILLILTVLLLGVLVRFQEVQIIPDSKTIELERWSTAHRSYSMRRAATGVEEDEPWRPVIIGNPTHKTRRMSVLELGGLTRWSEIRRKNHLIDSISLEARHPNLATLDTVKHKLKEEEEKVIKNVRRRLSRSSSRWSGSRRSGSRRSEMSEVEGLHGLKSRNSAPEKGRGNQRESPERGKGNHRE